MIKATHKNGYTGTIKNDGSLFIKNAEGIRVLTAQSCSAKTEEDLLDILSGIPSFLEAARSANNKR